MKKIIATSIYIFITIVLMIMTISKDVMAVTYSEVSKPLICLVGTDYSYLLEYEGYTIINKLVDFTCVGTYNIIYQHNTTKETVTKRVDVINDNEFENIYYRYDKQTLLSTNNKIIDNFKINNVLFLLEEEIIDDIHIYTIAIYENNKQIKSIEIKRGTGITLNKMVFDNNNIYITGSLYVDNYGMDIYLMKLDFNGNLIFEETIGGLGREIVNGVDIVGEYLFVYGTTTSSGGLFKGVRQQEDAYIMKIHKDLFQVELVKVSSIANVNIFSNILIKDNLIYVIEQYSDTNNVQHIIKIYNLNLDLIMNNPLSGSYTLYPIKMTNLNNDVYIVAYQYNYMLEKYANRLYKINKDGQVILEYEYANYENENIKIFDYQLIENEPCILMYDYNSKNTIVYLKDKDITLDIPNYCEPIAFTNNNLLEVIDKNKNVYSIIYIENKEELYINNEIVYRSSKSKLSDTFEIYGNYNNIYVYEDEKVMVAFFKEIYVAPSVSILDKEIFDLNTIVEFNGIGYLNGKEIKSGYIIEEIGEYVLELFGINNERIAYKFEIKNLSNKDFSNSHENIVNELEVIVPKIKVDSKLNYQNNVEEKKPMIWYGLFLLPLISLVLSLSLIFRRKHEK